MSRLGPQKARRGADGSMISWRAVCLVIILTIVVLDTVHATLASKHDRYATQATQQQTQGEPSTRSHNRLLRNKNNNDHQHQHQRQAQARPQAQDPLRNRETRQEPQKSSCDLLLFSLSDNNNLANHCQCKELQYAHEDDNEAAPASIGDAGEPSVASTTGPGATSSRLDEQADGPSGRPPPPQLHVNQLDCAGPNLESIYHDLRLVAEQNNAQHHSHQMVRVDHLNVIANVSQHQQFGGGGGLWPSDDIRQNNKSHQRNLPKAKAKTKLQVDHVSLQLLITTAASRGEQGANNSTTRLAESEMIDFIDQLIDGTHLRSLAIYVETIVDTTTTTAIAREQQLAELGDTESTEYQANKRDRYAYLWRKLINLSRLELSLKGFKSPLVFGASICSPTSPSSSSNNIKSGSLNGSRLEWLNLASNEHLELESNVQADGLSQLAHCSGLKHISLESSDLQKFPLFSMFLLESANDNNNNDHSKPAERRGHANLISLNLANNKLKSFRDDLFTLYHRETALPNAASAVDAAAAATTAATMRVYRGARTVLDPDRCMLMLENNGSSSGSSDDEHAVAIFHGVELQFSALTQLDLSRNQLSDLTIDIGQLILCSMPNLNQLYLQHNKIVHLNLNSILVHPIGLMSATAAVAAAAISEPQRAESTARAKYDNQTAAAGKRTTLSRLEYIDLSSNRLTQISAWKQTGAAHAGGPAHQDDESIRIKSINLAHNHLSRPLGLMIDDKFINRIVFKESVDALNELAKHDDDATDSGELNLNQLNLFLNLHRTHAPINSKELPPPPPLTICDCLSPVSDGIIGGSSSSSSGNQSSSFEHELLVNELLMSNNQLDQITSQDFASKQCKNVQNLRLNRNQIKLIDAKAFSLLHELEQLDLSENLLTTLSDATFSRNTKLKSLNLAQNRLKLVGESLFATLAELEELFMAGNQLVVLPRRLLINNPRLSIIDLANNDLKQLEWAMFSKSSKQQLKSLNLFGNQLDQFTSNQLSNQINLSFNDNSNNISISNVSKHIAPPASSYLNNQIYAAAAAATTKRPSTPSVKKSSLTSDKKKKNSNNSSKSQALSKKQVIIKRQSKRQADDYSDSSLIFLILGSNQLSSFESTRDANENCDESNQFYQEIQELWLNNNRIRSIGRTSFKCFNSMRRLHLQANQIESIDKFAFTAQLVDHLEYIDLSQNKLTKIPVALVRLIELRHINLANNLIEGQVDLLEVFDVGKPTPRSPSELIVDHEQPHHDQQSQVEEFNLSENADLELIGNSLILLLNNSNNKLKQIQLDSIKAIKWQTNDHPKQSGNSTRKILQINPMRNSFQLDLLNLNSIKHIDARFLNELEDPLVSINKIKLSNVIKSIGENHTKLIEFNRNKLQQHSGEPIELDLSCNQLSWKNLQAMWFGIFVSKNIDNNNDDNGQQLASIVHLNLSRNSLDQWPINNSISSLSFKKSLEHLKLLDLSLNKLKYLIRNETMETCFNLHQLEALNLSSNSMISLMEFPTNNNNRQLISLNKLMPRLRHLDLSNNRLTWIPSQYFDHLNDLVTLNLGHNQLETMAPIITTRGRLLIDLSYNSKLNSIGFNNNHHRLDDDDSSAAAANYNKPSMDPTGVQNELILYRDAKSSCISCKSIDDYIRGYASDTNSYGGADNRVANDDHDHDVRLTKSPSHFVLLSKDLGDETEDHPDNDHREECPKLMDSIHSMTMNSVGGQLNLFNSIDLFGGTNKWYHLNLAGNKLTKLEQNSSIPQRQQQHQQTNVISLDLGQNRLRYNQALGPICERFPNLKSLILSQNQLEEFAVSNVDLFGSCQSLNMLDLSHNKLKSLALFSNKSMSNTASSSSSLRILKLNNNQLRDLNDSMLRLITSVARSLRLLDIRFNQFKALATSNTRQLLRPTSAINMMILGAPTEAPAWVHPKLVPSSIKFDLSIDNNALAISWNGTKTTTTTTNQSGGSKYEASVSSINTNKHNDSNSSLVIPATAATAIDTTSNKKSSQQQQQIIMIRLCTLRQRKQLARVCLLESDTVVDHYANYEQSSRVSRCFPLRSANVGPVCLTELNNDAGQRTPLLPQTTNESLFAKDSPLVQNADSSSLISNSRRNVGADASINHNNQQQHHASGTTATTTANATDPILNSIEYIKTSWLKLKEINLNDYLTSISSIQSDSIWITLNNGKYPIYMLTMVKFAIVLAAICIIILLIAMFTLLNHLSKQQCNPNDLRHRRRRCHSRNDRNDNDDDEDDDANNDHDDSDREPDSPRSQSEEMTTDSTNDDTLGTSRTSSSKITATSGSLVISGNGKKSCSSTIRKKSLGLKKNNSNNNSNSTDGSGGGRRSQSSGGSSRTTSVSNNGKKSSANGKQLNSTIINVNQLQAELTEDLNPRGKIQDFHNQLDPKQLIMHQQQLACLTPSSSLAPSSVETAETMQAVDSIQSGGPLSSVGGFTHHMNSGSGSGLAHDDIQQQQQEQQLYSVDQYELVDQATNYHQPPPIATVMRIVKSNSASGFGDKSFKDHHHHHPVAYGTLNPRATKNYPSTLKSKIRAIQQRHEQIHPNKQSIGGSSGFYEELDDNDANLYQLHRQQLDQRLIQHQGAPGARVVSTHFNQDPNEFYHNHHQQETHQHHQQQHQHQLSDLDPTTLSLLSINTALSSNNNFGKSSSLASQQVSPANTITNTNTGPNLIGDHHQQHQHQYQANQMHSSVSSINLNHLCNYHKLLQGQPKPAGEMPAVTRPSEIIMEQAEEELQQHHYPQAIMNDLLIINDEHGFPLQPPPPPPSR